MSYKFTKVLAGVFALAVGLTLIDQHSKYFYYAIAGHVSLPDPKTSLEAAMLVCFSASWPLKIKKLWTVKKSVGLSHGFLVMIMLGYACGIAAKLTPALSGLDVSIFLVILYSVNFTMVSAVLMLSLAYRGANTLLSVPKEVDFLNETSSLNTMPLSVAQTAPAAIG